jgi:hypothetical protein
MAIPALVRDFKEVLNSFNSNRVEYLLIGGYASARLTSGLFLTRNKVVRIGTPPIRIEILTSVSGVEFESCYAEREMIRVDEIVVPVISLPRLRAPYLRWKTRVNVV